MHCVATRLSRRGENVPGSLRGSLRVLSGDVCRCLSFPRLTIQSQPERGYSGVHVIWAYGSPKPGGGRQTDRQTDRSNGYGPSLKMLETPNISPLRSRLFHAQVAPSSELRNPEHGSYFFFLNVAVVTMLVCWPNSLVFFKGRFFLMIERRHHSMWYVLTSFLGDSRCTNNSCKFVFFFF